MRVQRGGCFATRCSVSNATERELVGTFGKVVRAGSPDIGRSGKVVKALRDMRDPGQDPIVQMDLNVRRGARLMD